LLGWLQYIGHGWQGALYRACSVPAKIDYAQKEGDTTLLLLKSVKKENFYFENS